MTLSLFVLGGVREIIGTRKLFIGIENLLGSWATELHLELFQVDSRFLLAILPPGAFIGLGLLLALENIIDRKVK